MSKELQTELHAAQKRMREVKLENDLLKARIHVLEGNKQVLESKIGQLVREKAGIQESVSILMEQIMELELEKTELEQALSEIYDGE